jgi:hypothetical protein
MEGKAFPCARARGLGRPHLRGRLPRNAPLRGRVRTGELERPKNPVLLLTGTELFSAFGPPQCWKEAGGTMKTFAESGFPSHSLIQLCDATQQLHLGMQPWHNEWAAEFEKRRAGKRKPPANP